MKACALISILLAALTSCDADSSSARSSDLDELLERYAAQPLIGEMPRDIEDGELHFLVAGHLYGSPGPEYKGRALPASSFTDHLEDLKGQEADFMVLTGDFVRALKEPFLSTTLEFLSKLEIDVFNAPGNHEIGSKRQRRSYTERWGRSFGGFRVGGSLFLILDTELDPWKITGEQLAFLRDALTFAAEAGIERAFIFAHRVLFATDDARYEVVFELANSKADWNGGNYASEVLPLLANFARERELTWISGDVGGVARSFGLFQDYDERHRIRYVASGLGEQAGDNVLTVRVGADGKTQLDRIPLKDPKMKSFSDCDLQAWQDRSRWLAKRRAERAKEKGK
ncbi:MAG: metallophosphoesterase family protein [Planctomycetota bacterium]|jgi:hypothetical protein